MGSERQAHRHPFVVGASPGTGRATPLPPTRVGRGSKCQGARVLDTRPASCGSGSNPSWAAILRPSPARRRALMPDLSLGSHPAPPCGRPLHGRHNGCRLSPWSISHSETSTVSSKRSRWQVTWCTSYLSGRKSSKQTVRYWRLSIRDTPSSWFGPLSSRGSGALPSPSRGCKCCPMRWRIFCGKVL